MPMVLIGEDHSCEKKGNITTARKNYVDYIKAIGMILVIIGHINFANSNLGIKEWVYSFHMPLFFFASGLVLKKTKLDMNYLVKKISTLMIPYILWALIYSKLDLKNLLYIGYGSYATINNAKSLSSLWFLPAMFLGLMLSQLILQVMKKWYQLLLAIALLFVISYYVPMLKIGYPWCFDVGIMAAGYILLGVLIETYLCNVTKTYWLVIIFICGSAGTLLFRYNVIEQNPYVLMARRYIGKPILFYIVAISGSLMVYCIARLIDLILGKRGILSFIGSNTLAIFAVHKPMIAICEKLWMHIAMPWFVELFVTGVITLMCSCAIVNVVNYFVPILNGKRNDNGQ